MEENIILEQNSVKDRLKIFLDYKKISQGEFEKQTSLSNGYVNNIRKSIKSETFDEKIAPVYPELNKYWLLHNDGEMLNETNIKVGDITNTGGNVVAGNTGSVNIGNEERENVVPQGELKPKQYAHTLEVRLVTNKAKAGWSDGYYNEEYLQDMPIVVIDADENYKGKYLAFEVAGDSMEPDYLEGDIVICREVQRHLWNSKLHFKDWDFVIAHSTQGIMLKEVIDHNVETGDIICRSINPKHKDFTLNLREIAHLYNVVEVRQKGRQKRWNRAKDFFEN